jgi:prepilin-type N-terminal cleavage/methylation domain-containing protein
VIWEFGIRKTESGMPAAHGLRARHSALRNPHSAFTLVELLVTIAIIGILSSLLLGAASLSMGTARQARTESLIARLHTLLSQHYDSFRDRRVEINPVAGASGQMLAARRLLGTREQMRLELPDRWSDITLEAIPSTPQAYDGSPAPIAPSVLIARPAMSRMFLRKYNQLAANSVPREKLLQNQGAECLYMIVMLAAGDGESRGLFSESDIGDTDGDGAPEFIDSWGNPISFLRWAPGFDSDVQLDMNQLAAVNDNDQVQQLVAENRDPFDLFRRDTFLTGATPRGFRLVPLIFSAGPDQVFGIVDGSPPGPDFTGQNVQTRNALFSADISLPFEQVSDPFLNFSGVYLGQKIPGEPTATDNIHNHLISGR